MSNNKPDLIVVRGGDPDAFAAIAVANAAYEAQSGNREITLAKASGGKRNSFTINYVQSPGILPYAEAQKHFRYVFGYNNKRSTQVIKQEAAKSNLVFFFGYSLLDEEMEQLLDINPNVYVFDYHRNQLSRRVSDRLSMYMHDQGKCAAQFAWDFYVPQHQGRYPTLVNEISTSIFKNRARDRELFFGFVSHQFLAPHWVSLLGSGIQGSLHSTTQRGQFFIEYHKVLQSQLLDSATIVRLENGKAIQKHLLTRNEKSADDLVIYMIQCTTHAAQYLARCIKELPIARRSIVVAYSHHIRESVYQYTVASNCDIDPMAIAGYDSSDSNCVSRNGAFLQNYGWFTTNVKPQMLLNSLVNRLSTMTSDPE